MRLGLLAILVGVVYLLRNLGLISFAEWNLLWPIILIYIGIAMVSRDRCWHCRIWHDGMHAKGKKGMDEHCDC
jgi:hypothetical protein